MCSRDGARAKNATLDSVDSPLLPVDEKTRDGAMLLINRCILTLMTTVLAFGTYDKLHPGHRWFLAEAKKLGDRLVVVVARDKNVERIKGHLPAQPEQQRLAQVQAVPDVDEANLGYEDYAKRLQVITDANPQIICLGYDQAPGFQSPDPNIKVVRLEAFHPDIYKSSKL